MIKPLDNSIATVKPSVLNLAFCAVPVAYENTQNFKPLGQKLDLECKGCTKPAHLGKKLDFVV